MRIFRLWPVCLLIGCAKGALPERNAPVTLDSAAAERLAAREPGALGTVPSDTVLLWAGPGDRPFEVARRTASTDVGHARRFGTITLPIVLRMRPAGLSQYPCSSCHAGTRLTMEARRISDAHRNIRPVHPDQTGAYCSTCHAGEDVARLALIRGGRATLDQSYRLCGQCHFRQVEAWAGGGHGKRLDGWQGRRVVLACTDCHDPHDPAVTPRIPFRSPRVARLPPRSDRP